jgi:ubiquinone/menaquinone biosynthesis C-methylase UbiE
MQQQPDPDRAQLPPAARLSHLIDGYLHTQLIAIAVRLGIPDLLAVGSRTAPELAAGLGLDPQRCWRVLRGLASIGVLEEGDDGTFDLTQIGELLRLDVPGSLAGPTLLRGVINYPAALELYPALTEGGIAFERAYGTDLFSFLQQSAEASEIFQASMTARSRVEAEAVARIRDFSEYETIIDVGGGTGVLLEAVLRANPRSRGALFDVPSVIAQARGRLAASDVAPRIEIVEGDFFETVTPGGNFYLLSRIVHDWNDDRARVILRNVRRAIAPTGALMLVEAVSPDRAADQPAIIGMDLHMLLMLDGRERTAAEFESLLSDSGFELTAIRPTGAPTAASLIEARPV